MRSLQTDRQQLVDVTGRPIPRKTTLQERVRSTTARTKALVGSLVAGLALAGGTVANIDKISGFFISVDADSETTKGAE